MDEHISVIVPTKTDSNPWPDVAIPEPTTAAHTQPPNRNPFIFRTVLSNPLQLLTQGHDNTHHAAQPPMSRSDLLPASSSHPGVDTDSPVSSRDGAGAFPWTAVDSGAAAGSKGPKVQTRVWSSDDDDRQLAAAAAGAGGRQTDRDVEGSQIGSDAGGTRGVMVETRIARSERKV